MPHFIAQSIVFDTAYNLNTLEPLGNWGADPAVLIVGKDSPFNTVADLLAPVSYTHLTLPTKRIV